MEKRESTASHLLLKKSLDRGIHLLLIYNIFRRFRLRIILHFIASVSMSELQHSQQGEMISEEAFLFT